MKQEHGERRARQCKGSKSYHSTVVDQVSLLQHFLLLSFQVVGTLVVVTPLGHVHWSVVFNICDCAIYLFFTEYLQHSRTTTTTVA